MIRQDQTMVELDDETDDSHGMEVHMSGKSTWLFFDRLN